MRWTLAEEIDK